MNYRADIQVLRGIAVLMVVLFHFGLTSFQSGFLGVDVFFVISGFLMAKLYQQGHVREFYARRAKRLLPAYYAIIVLTILAAAFLTVPSDFNQVKEQGIFALFFSSNIGFWLQNSYFSKAEFNPLLHLWSLGVEIQFYLFVPLVALIYRKSKTLLTLCFLGSLAACLVIITVSPKTSFFMMPLRVWEFLLGYWAALHINNLTQPHNKLRFIQWLLVPSLLCIPFIPVDGQALSLVTGHPASFALAVSVVTALALGIGLPEQLCRSTFGRVLEKLGKYSYSIYLVHFPIIVLSNYQAFGGTTLETNSLTSSLIQVLIVGILSLLSYHLIEQRRFKAPFRVAITGTFAIAISIMLSQLIQHINFTEEQYKIFAAWDDRATYRCGKIFRVLNPSDRICPLENDRLGEKLEPVILVGNSHADSIKTSFANAASNNGYKTQFYVANNPLMSGSNISSNTVIEDAERLGAKIIAVHHSPNGVDIEQLRSLVENASALDIKVAFILPVPVYDYHVPKALFEETTSGRIPEAQNYTDYLAYNESQIEALNSITSLNIISVADVLCSQECKITDEKGQPLYFDEGHLTLAGARLLEHSFEAIFK